MFFDVGLNGNTEPEIQNINAIRNAWQEPPRYNVHAPTMPMCNLGRNWQVPYADCKSFPQDGKHVPQFIMAATSDATSVAKF